MKILFPLFFVINLYSQTETTVVFSSGISTSDHVDLFYSSGLSFKDNTFRVEFLGKFFENRLALENKFGVQVGRFYGFGYFQAVPKIKKQEQKQDVTNNFGFGLVYRFKLLDGNVLELGGMQSLFEYKMEKKLTFFSISITREL